MRKNSILKLLLVLIAVIWIGSRLMESASKINLEAIASEKLYLTDEIEGKEISYTLFKSKAMKSYYVVLPAMYEKESIDLTFHYDDKYYDLYLDDKKYSQGDVWREIKGEEIYHLKILDMWGRICLETPLQVLISEKLPVMIVTVESKDALYDLQEFSNKQYVEKGDVVMFDKDGKLLLDTNLEKIAVRGNTSAELPKKPFRIEFTETVSLCGMEPATKWNLLANAKDETHIRNKLMLDWAAQMGEGYNVDSEYLELYVNGEYQGIYLLTETVTTGENRLELNPDNSVFAEMDLYYRAPEEKNYIVTDRQHYWVIHAEEKFSDEKLKEIENWFSEVESALYSEDGKGEESRKPLEELLDFDSWTDAWLLEEISADVDLGTTSQFAYIEDWEGRSILKAGPEWDFDSSLGNTSLEVFKNPRNLVAAIPNIKGIECVTQNKWLSPMYENEAFKEMLVEKFRKEIKPKVKALLEWQIDDYAKQIERATLLDSLKWNKNIIENVESDKMPQDYHRYQGVDSRIEYLKEFIREKEQFLTELWIEEVEFEVIIEERNYVDMNLELNNDIYTWIRKEDMEEQE